jgi:carbon monoxide dehydrogenase subunit G
MVHFEGNKSFPQAPAHVWGKLTDARFLAECVPGVEAVTHAEPARVSCTLRPGFAFVRGTLELSIEVVDAVPDKSARIVLNTKGIGTTSAVEASFTLGPEGAGTRMHWSADVKTLGGLLKAVPQGLIKAAADKVITDSLVAIEAKLNA